MTFDELNKTDLGYNGLTDFEAGQQSRQAEIDTLQKRIENVLKYVGDDFEDFYEGELVKGVHEILKGEWDD